ncbi:hypothetical protein EVAR_23478_1 [Eumeta japonica]|uniref:Uncharacterized protein n=1 Tax=Eumeta variegata TaxID=151549 RepID=A0A4C1UKV1_EUMVA|nr:hypothetical protein EVAR_23478_1 [Eumeta japonica]
MGAQSPPILTSPHGYNEALKRNLQGMMEECNLSYMSAEEHMPGPDDYPSQDDYGRASMLNGYGGGSGAGAHDVKAEDLSADADVKPNIYSLKTEMQASDYSNKDYTNSKEGPRSGQNSPYDEYPRPEDRYSRTPISHPPSHHREEAENLSLNSDMKAEK